ncbi:hypothetical protein HZB02_03910 [Candidatus Woesearchaeota archaeon]|nr:hypothetical protein [Candidatus Woesearchaeota archaeon]
MAINIDVYCKKQPTFYDLVRPLKLKCAETRDSYEAYTWTPEGCNNIRMMLQKTPEIISDAYDKESIDENIARARFAGIEIPDGLTQKFERDNLFQTKNRCTLMVENAGSSIREPLTARPSCPSEEAYTIQADRELYAFSTQFPYLEDVDPWFRLPLGLAKFTEGAPTYEVSLEVGITASQQTLEHMIKLAGYFAQAFDGIIFDTDNNKFRIPNPEELYQQNMAFFFKVARDAKTQGAQIILPEF